MTAIAWDQVGDRVYETGVDRGVLYLPDGSAVPWNGLTSVVEKFDKSSEPVYYDGAKISDLVYLGNFSATMKAVTYPEEFNQLEGLVRLTDGIFVGDQPHGVFGLCWRTKIGSDVDQDSGYKIHLLYNVTATPSDRTYTSISDEMDLTDFEWSLSAVPEDIPGFRPTAHIILDSRDMDPWLLHELEYQLYGTSEADAALLPIADMVNYIDTWYRFRVVDNEDGTATITSLSDEGIVVLDEEEQLVQIVGISAPYLGNETYLLLDTDDPPVDAKINIVGMEDGTWIASTDYDATEEFITVDETGYFEIEEANVTYLDEDTYEVTDTPY